MTTTFDPAKLQIALETIHHAGLPGVFAEARAGDETWRGAAGVADLATGRPVTADLRHRVGSITKTFTAAAVLRLVEDGLLALDTPVGPHLPHLVPGERGAAITIRMLIDHTSGLADLLPYAYPSLAAFPDLTKTTPASLDDHRFTRFVPADLIELGVSAPATGAPGGRPGVYSNTNYLLLCELITAVTGLPAREYITTAVLEPAGLRDTELPTGPELDGPHSLHYESWFGMIDPPRDYSVYDMSWVGPAASLISTVADLNRFFRLLLAGEIVSASSLEQMRRTGPVVSFEGKIIEYGLGLQKMTLPGHGEFWGHEGSVWGGGALSWISADGTRQLSVAVNMQRWNELDATGKPLPHPIDHALGAFVELALSS
ncbi:serine hydrolase domain-containing protein [Nocardia asteroides]|uniref:serine hydrolase domain-containing protein n=1 Tax=Nocardia asteroides TaxID=1824 RepID=UPI001E5A7111|nr:serine hydrolase domain-containing protein [Nocardia asteroides]UGT53154.1 beta-lactamase family protein [Nocardia asteroides]